MLKKILSSKAFRIIFSLVLIYFAFRKVNMANLILELAKVPLWFVLFMLVYMFFSLTISSARWSILLLKKPTLADFLIFTKASYLGGFYSLFFPTMVAGDLMKWLPLLKHYPELSKTKLVGSVLIDRVIGFTAFVIIGLLALIFGKLLHYQFPDMLLWLFSALALAVTVFYLMVMFFDFEKFFGQFKLLKKIIEIVDLLKNENKNKILICLLISIVAEPIWMLPFWFFSLMFGVGLSLVQVYIFVPIVTLILVLPISIAGFGARENLFLFFLVPLGFAADKVLLMSTFSGIMGVLTSLIGGIFLLLPNEKK